jgi:polysaccharide biosynthesis transport protein
MKTIESISTDNHRPKDEGRHLYEYLQVINRRKWYILLFFLTVVGLVGTWSYRADKVYQASALLMIDRKPSPMNPMGEGDDRAGHALTPYYNTQINLLSHRSLIENVIADLNLKAVFAKQDEEGQANEESPAAEVTTAARFEGDGPTAPDPHTARILGMYARSLGVEPVRDSNLVRISFSGKDPVLITRIINTHAEKAIENAVTMHRAHAENALKWIRSQVDKQKQEVENYQRRIFEFKKANNLVTMGDPRNIHTQEITDLNAALTRAKADRIAKHTAYLQAEKLSGDQLEIFLSPEVLGNSVIALLRNQLVQLKGVQIELGSRFGPRHPRMVELKAGIEQTRAELEAEISRLKRAYKTEAEKAATLEASIEQMLQERQNVAMRLGEKSIEYDVLQQQAESSREIYDFLLQQAEEIHLFSVMSSSNLRIIDRAEVPLFPVSPKIKLNIMAAAVLSLMLGVGVVLFFDLMDNTLKTPDEVVRYLGIPVLGTVPFYKELKHNGNKYLPHSDLKQIEYDDMVDGPLSSISSRLPVELTTSNDGTIGRVIAIESVTMGEGKTMTTTKMAASLSEAGLRVLLLDCDFQRSSLNKVFDNADGGGLEDIIQRIQSHQVTSGSLKDYSMDDLFFLIELHKLNGRLIVKNEDQLLHALFQNGKLLHIQNSNNPKANRIGAMLLQGNFITKDQLNDAIERHRRTGQPLGYILVNSGYISLEKLRGPLRLQMEEHIQRLFSWKTGQFHFKPELIRIYENERIFFGDNHAAMIRDLGRITGSLVVEKVILSNIRSGSKENLYFLPANSNSKRPIGRINRVLLKKILDIVKDRFDVVLIDTPPLDARTGVESLLSSVDGVVVVIDAGRLSYRVINSAINTLPKDKIIGAILNKVKTKENNYAYYM